MAEQRFIEAWQSFFIDSGYVEAFEKLGLTSFDALFSFSAGRNLAKSNLAGFRSRLQFEIESQ